VTLQASCYLCHKHLPAPQCAAPPHVAGQQAFACQPHVHTCTHAHMHTCTHATVRESGEGRRSILETPYRCKQARPGPGSHKRKCPEIAHTGEQVCACAPTREHACSAHTSARQITGCPTTTRCPWCTIIQLHLHDQSLPFFVKGLV